MEGKVVFFSALDQLAIESDSLHLPGTFSLFFFYPYPSLINLFFCYSYGPSLLLPGESGGAPIKVQYQPTGDFAGGFLDLESEAPTSVWTLEEQKRGSWDP